MSRIAHVRRGRGQHGLTVVEIMVALAVGALLLAGVGVLFAEVRQTGRVEQGLSQLQESARFTLTEVARELRMAGYFGCADEDTLVNTLNNPGSYDWNFSVPVQGHENTGGSTWSPALPSRLANLTPAPAPDSDIFTVRTIEPGTLQVERHPGGDPPGSADLQLVSMGDLQRYDVVVAMDCPNAAVFEITNINTNNNLVHNTGAVAQGPGNATDNLQANFADGSVGRISTRTYFTRTDNDGNVGLWVTEPVRGPRELVEGVERLRIRYGEDADGDLRVDAYRDADQVADWAAVVSVEVSLLVRSTAANLTNLSGQQSIAFEGAAYGSDGRLRRRFQSTVALRNRLP